MRKYTLELPVVLNETEVAEKGRELAAGALRAAQLEGKISEVKEDARDTIKAYKEKLTEVRGRVKTLAKAVRKMEINQEVEVEARVADDNSKVEVVRLDTGAVVETRALSEQDRQMQIEDVLAKIEQDTKAAEKSEPEDEDLEEEDEDGELDEDDEDKD